MIQKFNIKLTYKTPIDEKEIKIEKDGLKEYGFNNNQTMIYFTEKVKSNNEDQMVEKIFWVRVEDIIFLVVDYIREFETKKEKLEFFKANK